MSLQHLKIRMNLQKKFEVPLENYMISQQEVQQGINFLKLILQFATASTSPCCLITDSFQLSSLLRNLPPRPQSTEFVSSTKYFKWWHKGPRRRDHMPFLFSAKFCKLFFWVMPATKWPIVECKPQGKQQQQSCKIPSQRRSKSTFYCWLTGSPHP